MTILLLSTLLAACAQGPNGARPLLSFNGITMEAEQWNSLERGKQHFAQAQYGLALEAFKDALAENPGSVRALNAIAASFDQLQRFDVSDRYYAKALELHPESPEVLNNLGYSHLLRGNLDEARRYLALAARADARNPVIEANLQLAGREETAIAERAGESPATLPSEPAAAAAFPPRLEAPHQRSRVVRIARGVKLLVTQPPGERRDSAEDVRTAAEPSSMETTVAAKPARREQSAKGLTPVAFRAPARDKVTPDWTVEVSNGTGRSRMAARMRQHLGAKGVPVTRLTNDATFSNATSRIVYRPRAEAGAALLRAMLPTQVRLEVSDDQHADIRLVLGADLLEFDAELIERLER